MKVRTKFNFLALILMCFCLVASFSLQQQDSAYLRSTFHNELIERQANLRNIIDLYFRPLKVFSTDYSYWDEMVAFINKPNPVWAEENIRASLETFDADAIWIFDAKKSLVYSTALVSDEYLQGVFNVIEQASARIQRETLISFFLSSPKGPIQVYGASVHPTSDALRQTPPAGYLFIGKLLDATVLREIGALSASSVIILSFPLSSGLQSFQKQDTLVFSLPLEDVSRNANVFLCAQMDVPELIIHERTARKRIIFLSISFLFLFIAIAGSFFYLVNRPLYEISSLLSASGIPVISGLCKRHDEFGGIAQIILEFKRQKLELAREKELTQKYLDIARVMLVVLSSRGKVILVNKEVCRVLGFGGEEMLAGQDWFEAVIPESSRSHDRSVFNDIVTGKVDGLPYFEGEVVRKDGQHRLVAWHNAVIRDDFGSVTMVVSSGEDITDSKEFADALSRSEKKYRQLVETLQEGIWMFDGSFKTTYVNPRMADMLGDAVEEVLGKNAADLIVPEQLDQFRQLVRLSEQGVKQTDVFGVRHRDGAIVFMAISLSSLFDEQGVCFGTLAGMQDVTALKRAQQEQRDQADFLRILLDAMPNPIFYKDANGMYLGCNQAFARYVGLRPEEIIGKSVFDIAPRDLAEAYDRMDKQLLHQGGGLQVYEKQVCNINGAYKDVIFYKALYRNPITNKNGIIGAVVDISERRQIERQLRSSEEKYRSFVENLNVGVYRDAPSPEACFVQANPALVKMLGYGSVEELLQVPVGTLYLDTREREKIIKDIIAHGSVGSREVRLRKKDGTSIIGSICAGAVRGEAGEVLWIDGILEDITDRKAAEEELKHSRQVLEDAHRQLSQIIDFLPDCTFVINKEGVVIAWNRAAEEMTGVKKDAILGKSGYVHGQAFYGQPRPILIDLALKNDPDVEKKYTFVKKVGSLVCGESVVPAVNNCGGGIVWGVASLLFDADGQVVGAIESVRDISVFKRSQAELEKANAELKDTQEQLIQSSKMVAMGQLAAGVSHELNQPLTGIKGFAQMALESAAGNPALCEDLGKIIDQANRMDAIIRNVRFFARKSAFSLVPLNVNQPIEDALMLVGEQFKVHSLVIEKNLQPGLPDILADANQLQQVFLNLLTNARDAVEEAHKQGPGEIGITSRLSADRHWVEVNISDSGCGIALEHQQSIFNPFFTTKSPNGGIGLGLAIVYRIIESHKGSISFKSTPGVGTVFTLKLPVYGGDHAMSSETKGPA